MYILTLPTQAETDAYLRCSSRAPLYMWEHIGYRLCRLLSFSGVTFVLFSRLFVFSLKRRPFVELFFDIHVPQHPHVASYNCLCPLFSFCFFFVYSWEVWRFPNILYHYYSRFLVVVCRVPFTFSFRMVFFYLVTTVWGF